MEILKAHDIDVDGKHVVLVGKGKLVSRPLMHLLLKTNKQLSKIKFLIYSNSNIYY